jgi:hypothetical protein
MSWARHEYFGSIVRIGIITTQKKEDPLSIEVDKFTFLQ